MLHITSARTRYPIRSKKHFIIIHHHHPFRSMFAMLRARAVVLMTTRSFRHVFRVQFFNSKPPRPMS